ncbi:hypothetical protein H6G89_11235 [Oscillatoria sp. FACHB-1407]|uniref:hypothetical protein n=1 Tax=Oscillatoria sp. FACHB-1407 TaxID=2692847 RepID=UPI001689491C|nr:hypothetical protein [Oscillatoria sp. FACHB-1407]MBD2461624.1 hypothetical protein [Oscillatoria sp. FACHB-1407]
MKILEHTSTRLTLQRHPTGMSWFLLGILWLFGGSFSGIGVLIAQAVSVRSLMCQRVEATQVNCELTEGNVFNAPVNTTAIAALQEATVATDPLGEAPAYSVILYSQTKELEFSNSNDRGSQEAIARQLNEFIQNAAETRINLQDDDRGLQLWVSAGFLLGGLGLMVWGINLQEVATYTFDKPQNSLTLNRHTLLRHQTTTWRLECFKWAFLLDETGQASTILLEVQCPESQSHHPPERVQLTNAVYTYTRASQQELVNLVNQFASSKQQ